MIKIIQLINISKSFQIGSIKQQVLSDINICLKMNSFISVMGPSGSGKSTLLNIIAGLLPPDVGKLTFENNEIYKFNEEKRTVFRREKIGYIFQFFNLLPQLTIYENIILPLLINKSLTKEKKEWIEKLIVKIGLKDKIYNPISVLSGGEMQRVAIARALSHQPEIILADEPTGNVSAKMGQEIMSLLIECHRDFKQTILLVTHNYRDAAKTGEVYFLKGGTIPLDCALKGESVNEHNILSKLQELKI